MSDVQLIRQFALDALSRREHSRFELTKKLLAKEFPQDLIEVELTRLVELGYLSDARFTEVFIRSRTNRGCGPLRIIQELRQRGIGAELLESVDARDPEWQRLANTLRCKRFGEALPHSQKEKAAQLRFLLYRGFSQSQCYQALKTSGYDDEDV